MPNIRIPDSLCEEQQDADSEALTEKPYENEVHFLYRLRMYFVMLGAGCFTVTVVVFLWNLLGPVGRGGGDGVKTSALRVAFQVQKGDSESPNGAVIRVWNLSDETLLRSRKEFDRVILQAGYQDNYGLIYSGDVMRQGYMTVAVASGLVKANGAVYVRVAGASADHPLGTSG
jgi:hypothetical protein